MNAMSWKEFCQSLIDKYRERVERIVKKEIDKQELPEEIVRNQTRSIQLNTTFFE